MARDDDGSIWAQDRDESRAAQAAAPAWVTDPDPPTVAEMADNYGPRQAAAYARRLAAGTPRTTGGS